METLLSELSQSLSNNPLLAYLGVFVGGTPFFLESLCLGNDPFSHWLCGRLF